MAKELKLRSQRNKAVSKFRTRKADRQSYVVVTKEGKRAGTRNQRGYLVYVSNTGRKTLVQNPRLSRSENLRPQKPHALGFAQAKRFKTAQKKYFATFHKLAPTQTLKATAGERGHVSLDRFAAKAGLDLHRHTQSRAGGEYSVKVGFVVRDKAGKTRAFSANILYRKAGQQNIGKAGAVNFFRHAGYAFMAEQLQQAGLVTAGSAERIRRLNVGVPREEWVDKRGEPWGKADCEVVKVEQIEWQIEKLSVRSG